MKNISKQKLIKDILKVLCVKNEKSLYKLNKKNRKLRLIYKNKATQTQCT